MGSGVHLDQVWVALLLESLGCRVFLEILDPKAQLALLERKEKRVSVKMEPQASQGSLAPQVTWVFGDFLDSLVLKVTGGWQDPLERLEQKVNGDSLVQWDPRGHWGLLEILEPGVLK